MRGLIIVIAYLGAFTFLNAQGAKEAKALLDEVSEKAQSLPNQKIVFNNIMEIPSAQEGKAPTTRKMAGLIYVNEDAYRLELNGLIYINDGKKMYIVDPEIEEIDVTELDGEAPLTPTAILKEFDKKYSMKMGPKISESGKSIQQIYLKPIGESEVKDITLGIDTKTKLLYSYQMTGQNKVVTTLTILQYLTEQNLPSNTFKYDPNEWEGYELND